MRICAIICEFNPFHKGHQYLIEQVKKRNEFDAVLCIMSENFTQRGDIAICSSYVRAKHAVFAGADAVISLPVPFATSSAEIFAKGAIQILSSIPSVCAIAFGVESGNAENFIRVADALNHETDAQKEIIHQNMKNGMSFIQARELAYAEYRPFLSSPNNILAIEYTRAILSSKSNIQILPIQRQGQNYSETEQTLTFASASSIRANLNDRDYLSRQLPSYVFNDVLASPEKNYQIACMTALQCADRLSECMDCTEGLENAILNRFSSYDELVETVSSKRYTKARIRRILLHNLLGVRKDLICNAIKFPLYIRLLALGDRKEILSELSKSSYPLLTKGEHSLKLKGTARQIYELELKSERIYEICSRSKISKKIF